MPLLWLAAVVLLAGEGPGAAAPEMLGFVDAADLSQFCSSTGPQGLDPRLVCLSYVMGAADQLLAQQALGASADRTICVPRNATAESVMQEVTAYATWSKTAKGVGAANFVRYAMERAYPCKAIDADVM